MPQSRQKGDPEEAPNHSFRHTKRVLQVNEYRVDNEFKKIEADIVPYLLHTQASGEHEPTSERNIRIIKYSTRSTVPSVPNRKMSLMIIDSRSEQVQYMLNYFPSKNGL